MSKMKKVISLVLCVAMLAGTFTFLGDLIAPSASAAGTSNVAKYADIDAKYDKFVYVGIDVIEVANGELTDGYVQPGDWLEYHMTLLSDMYIGTASPHLVYTKNFFDVRVVTSMNKPTHDNYTNTDYEGNLKFTKGELMNPDHPYAAPNVATYHTLTALPATKVANQMGFCEIDATTYNNWDLVKSNVGITTTSWDSNFPMTTDTWWTMWYVRVKDGLADGTQGQSFSPEAIWKNQINPSTGKGDTRRFADVYTGDTQGLASASASLTSRYNVVTLILDDTYHTFEIGTGEAPVEKKTVTFQKYDGTVIESGEYAEGDTVAVPEVEGLVAWTESSKAVELGESFTMGQKALTYVAVVETDEFNVTINLVDGVYAEDAVLPEGAEVKDGKLIIKAGFGEEVDLTTLPLPEKEGYTGAWDPSTVKVDSTRGANATIKWTKATYTAKFYLDKDAFDAGADALREVTFVYGNKVPFTSVNVSTLKTEEKFAGWINAETGEKVNEETIFADNVAFYADWTEFNSALTVWGRDYENGGWKELATKKADAGTTIKLNDIKALVTEENYGTAAAVYMVSCTESAYDTNKAVRADFAMPEGKSDIYIFTNIKYNVTFKTPVFDEEGFITEEYAEEVKSFTSNGIDAEAFLDANAYAPAPAEKTGYKFAAWIDEEGNEFAAGTIALDYANGTERTLTAKYEEVVYTIEFVINYAADIDEIINVEGTFKLGDTFTLSEAEIYKLDSEGEKIEAVLPEIGVENAEQAGGPYMGVDGYKFAGWKVGTRADQLSDYDITKEVTLTPAVIAQTTINDKIAIKGVWEALEYEFIAYYADTIGEDGKPVYKAMDAVMIKTGTNLDATYAAAQEVVNANLPEGRRFQFWKLEDGSNKPNKMTAGKLEVYATYVGSSLSLYVDYNNGTDEVPVDLEKSMELNKQIGRYLFVGVDVENDSIEGESGSIAHMVRSLTITEANHPGTTYELVGWDIYYVENEADVYDTTKWKSGISDIEGSTIAKYTLIFQAKWMAHKDFLFRVYNTEGVLRSAMDKKFNKYFWYMDKPVDKETAHPLNALPDRLIIIGFLPKIESGFAIRIEPITISKAWLDPSNWGALLEALFNGIKTGFGGELW